MSDKLKNITESQSLVSQEINDQIVAVLSSKIEGFEKAFITASAIGVLQEKLSPEFMKPIMALQGSNLGFKVDKVYTVEEVKSCLIDAVLLGLQPTGNEFNIIAKNMYPTRQGFGSLLKKINGLRYSISYSNPIFTQDKSSANCTATIKWELNGESNVQEQEFAIKSNAYATADAILGKAERKARRWLYNTVQGTDIPDGDVTDIPHTIVSSEKPKANEVASEKERQRVINHINLNTTTSVELLERCIVAIQDNDLDLIEEYSRKHIELSKTIEELNSLKFLEIINSGTNLDLIVLFEDKKRELKPAKK